MDCIIIIYLFIYFTIRQSHYVDWTSLKTHDPPPSPSDS